MSQECSSLDGSTIGQRVMGDGDSHASLIPGPRSCTVSIASSFDTFNMNANGSIATASSIAEVMVMEGEALETVDPGSAAEKDNLSVLESISSHEDDV